MPWVSVQFKGKEVWAEVDDGGNAIVAGGMRKVRYSQAAGAKVYTASASNIQATGAAPISLPEPAEAEAVASARPAPARLRSLSLRREMQRRASTRWLPR
jgi:hypothetical protein